jgi:hypothetical protein
MKGWSSMSESPLLLFLRASMLSDTHFEAGWCGFLREKPHGTDVEQVN